MKFFPDFKTVVDIGPLSIKWYAVFILVGAFIAYWLSKRNFKKAGYNPDIVIDLFFGVMIFGAIGARLWFVLFDDPAYYFADITRLVDTRSGGLAIQGGLFLGAAYAFYFAKKHKINFLHLADMVLPNVLVAQAFGRWGNFMNQEAFGRIVSEAYYSGWPSFIKNTMYIDGAFREPTFLYESVANIVGWLLITFVYKKYGKPKRGDLMAGYLIWYGITRFFIEGFRSDSLMFMGLRTAQLVSLAFILLGVLGILGVYRRFFNKKPVVLFDFDGTLANTEQMILETYHTLFRKYRPDYTVTREDELYFLGPPLKETFPKYFKEDVDTLIEEYRATNHKLHHTMLTEMAGTTELLKYLKEENYQVGIVSSKLHGTVELGCSILEIDQYIDVIVGLDDVKNAKPDPEGIHMACDLLNLGYDNTIYVGDSASDILAGKNANSYTIGYLYNEERKEKLVNSKPNKVISDLLEIKEILKEDHSWTSDLM